MNLFLTSFFQHIFYLLVKIYEKYISIILHCLLQFLKDNVYLGNFQVSRNLKLSVKTKIILYLLFLQILFIIGIFFNRQFSYQFQVIFKQLTYFFFCFRDNTSIAPRLKYFSYYQEQQQITFKTFPTISIFTLC